MGASSGANQANAHIEVLELRTAIGFDHSPRSRGSPFSTSCSNCSKRWAPERQVPPPPQPKLCAFLAYKFTTQLVDSPARTPCSAQDTFKQWELERRVPPPPLPLRVAMPFAGESTYTGTYPPHTLAPPQLLPPAAAPRAHTQHPFKRTYGSVCMPKSTPKRPDSLPCSSIELLMSSPVSTCHSHH